MTGDDPDFPASAPEQPDPQPQAPQTDLRAQLMGQFEQWLDQMLAEEPPPRGLPEYLLTEATAMAAGGQSAQETDLYNLFSALTRLTGEIRLQGRAFNKLTDLLSPLSETPAILERLHEVQVGSIRMMQAALADQADDPVDPDEPTIAFTQVCDVMIDLYDRLQRGLQTCDEGIQSLRARRQAGLSRWLMRGADPTEPAILSVQGIRDATALTLARLQAALQEWGIQRIGRVGDPFDSERMSAVEVCATDRAEPGSVVLVNRSGYALNGVLKATAQVTVAKAGS